MGCSGCGGGGAGYIEPMTYGSTGGHPEDLEGVPCDFDDVRLNDMKVRLTWFKQNGLFLKYNVAPGTLNQYLGIVLTSININNKCYYRNILVQAAELVDLIIVIQNEQ